MDRIRVLRIIEYVGPRDEVEAVVKRSIHGTLSLPRGRFLDDPEAGRMTITAVTLNEYPEVLRDAPEFVRGKPPATTVPGNGE